MGVKFNDELFDFNHPQMNAFDVRVQNYSSSKR